MTIDVEDYYQVSAFDPYICRDDWAIMPSRIENNVYRILDILDTYNLSATFFTLGWIAERYPKLICELVQRGHELASHGYAHIRVNRQDRAEFLADVQRTKYLLEDIGGVEVKGYRAASYSIDHATPWAHDVLRETGHCYSSSIYPVRHDHYGVPDAPRFAFHPIAGDACFTEIPISTIAVRKQHFPCGGGGYFRLYPYVVSRWAFKRLNQVEGQAGIFYFHPWEIDPEQPRIQGLSFKTRFRHYLNLKHMQSRWQQLLRDFHWDRMDHIFL